MLRFELENKPELLSLGILSGTSVDGIDVGLTKIPHQTQNQFPELLAFETLPFDPSLQARIQAVIHTPQNISLQELSQINFLLGHAFAEAALTFLSRQNLSPREIDFIASHGQTFWHQPQGEMVGEKTIRSTFQLGESAMIASATGLPVISDFRVADIAAGGEGAPLMPFLDHLLFHSDNTNRLILNIGGISNISAIASGTQLSGIISFDCGPGNTLIDQATMALFNQPFDKDGLIAQKGKINYMLLNELLHEPYYKVEPPKSTGRELFSAVYLKKVLARAKALNIPNENIITTLSELTVFNIYAQYKAFIEPKFKCNEIIISGGGSHNPYLMSRFKTHFPSFSVITMEEATGINISSKGKEAVLFSVLGYSFLMQQSASVHTNAILGKLSIPPLS